MSFEFFAFTSSSSLRRSLMGSVCFCTHFFRAIGLTLPQNPSRDCWFNGFAVGEGCCCCAAAGGVSWEPVAGCACCAPAGIEKAATSAKMAIWLGNKLRARYALIECSFFLKSVSAKDLRAWEQVLPARPVI